MLIVWLPGTDSNRQPTWINSKNLRRRVSVSDPHRSPTESRYLAVGMLTLAYAA